MQRLTAFLFSFLFLCGCATSTAAPPDESMNTADFIFACYAVEADYRAGDVQTDLRIRFWDDVGFNVVLETAHDAGDFSDGASITGEVRYGHDDGYYYRGDALFELDTVDVTGLETVQTPPSSPTAGFGEVSGTIGGRIAIEGTFERPAELGGTGTPVVDVVLYKEFVIERCVEFDAAYLP